MSKRILYIHQNITGQGGEAAEAQQTLSALVDAGAEVGILYRRVGHVACKFDRQEIRDFGSARLDFRSTLKAISQFRPHIAHIKSCWTPAHCRAASALRSQGVPYIVEPGGHLFDVLLTNRYGGKKCRLHHLLAKRIFRQFYDRPMVRNALAIRSLSSYEALVLENKFGVRCHSIPMGFNEEWINAAAGRPWTKPSGRLHFLFLGRLDVFQKGLDLIIDAAALLNAQGYIDRYKVTLAGPSWLHSDSYLSQRIDQKQLPNISISGPAYGHDKQRLFESAHVFLHPSRFEEMAKVVREASALGLPVIASRESNYADWATRHGFGLCTELSSNSLAAQMGSIIDRPETLPYMSQAATQYALATSWPSIGQRMLSMCKEILN